MEILPIAVIRMMAQRQRRMHHYVWHQVRNNWLFWENDVKEKIRTLGWEPPRPAREPTEEGQPRIILDNNSGEDFLYMHRQMITATNIKLADVQDPTYLRVEGWPVVPRPEDSDYPVPPAWDTGEQGFNDFLNDVKSDEYFLNNFVQWEGQFTSLSELANMSLGELGARLEFSIHNMMHMRWCEESEIRPDIDPTTPEQISPVWDKSEYMWLGDTYSSHVNPHFWKLHGWIDDRVNDWMSANGVVGEVPWTGKWVGKMPPHPVPESLHATLAVSSDEFFLRNVDPHVHFHDHASEMEEVVRLVIGTGKLCHFYDEVIIPE